MADIEMHNLMKRKMADDNDTKDIGHKERINNNGNSSTVGGGSLLLMGKWIVYYQHRLVVW